MAPDLFLCQVDEIMEEAVEQRQPEAQIESERCADLDYADNVALLVEVLEILVLCLEIMDVSWAKIKIKTTIDPCPMSEHVWVAGNQVELIAGFSTSALISVMKFGSAQLSTGTV